MGCDIHLNVERKVGDRWIYVPQATLQEMGWPQPEGMDDWEYDSQDYLWFRDQHIVLPDYRNYYTFGMLAGVRQKIGVVPIDQPRGLPDDCTWKSKENVGDHSFSWLMLEEVINHTEVHEWAQEFVDIAKQIREMIPGEARYVFGFDS
jgi:hypothetical protein